MTTKKTFASFMMRIWSGQDSVEQSNRSSSQRPVDVQATYTIILTDLETGSRVGFSSIEAFTDYLVSVMDKLSEH